MENTKLKKIADNADMIVNGYAFTQNNENYRVLNLKSLAIIYISPLFALLHACMFMQAINFSQKKDPQNFLLKKMVIAFYKIAEF